MCGAYSLSKFSFCVRSFFSCAMGRLQKSPCFRVRAFNVAKSLRISDSSASSTTQCDSRVDTTPVRSISAYSELARADLGAIVNSCTHTMDGFEGEDRYAHRLL